MIAAGRGTRCDGGPRRRPLTRGWPLISKPRAAPQMGGEHLVRNPWLWPLAARPRTQQLESRKTLRRPSEESATASPNKRHAVPRIKKERMPRGATFLAGLSSGFLVFAMGGVGQILRVCEQLFVFHQSDDVVISMGEFVAGVDCLLWRRSLRRRMLCANATSSFCSSPCHHVTLSDYAHRLRRGDPARYALT